MILSRVVNGDADFVWQDLAACQGMAEPRRKDGTVVDYFFDTYEAGKDEDRAAAEALCASCPVKQNCLIYGLENKLTGLWGGKYLEDGTIK